MLVRLWAFWGSLFYSLHCYQSRQPPVANKRLSRAVLSLEFAGRGILPVARLAEIGGIMAYATCVAARLALLFDM